MTRPRKQRKQNQSGICKGEGSTSKSSKRRNTPRDTEKSNVDKKDHVTDKEEGHETQARVLVLLSRGPADGQDMRGKKVQQRSAGSAEHDLGSNSRDGVQCCQYKKQTPVSDQEQEEEEDAG